MNDRVSIIIPCYQQGTFLAKAAESALSQTHRNLEVIIINDGSTDSTRDVAEHLRVNNPERVKVIHQQNQGQARAREAGLQLATGEAVVMLDADDQLEPAMAETCLRAFAEHPNADAVVGNAWLMRPDGQTTIRLFEQNRIAGWPEILTHNPYGALCAIMVRRAAIEAVGGPAADGMPGCEDWDLWVRMARCGMKFVPVEATLGRYRQTPHSYSRRALTMLKSSCELLRRCVTTDPRLANAHRSVAPPIAESVGLRLRNARVFYFLGVAVAAGAKMDAIQDILAMLLPGAFDPALSIEQFAWGIQFSQLAGGASPILIALKSETAISLVTTRLKEVGSTAHSEAIAIMMRETMENLIESKSLLLRARNRLISRR
jgi:glycosyltransferase involved in cell wall biosynthesis